MPRQLHQRTRSTKHSIILLACRICKVVLELAASYAYGLFVYTLSRSLVTSVISGATLFVLSQTLTQLGHAFSGHRRVIGSALLWIMKLVAALFESLALLSANLPSAITEQSLSGKVTEAFVNLLRTEPLAVAMLFLVFFGVDLAAHVLPEEIEESIEWVPIVEGMYIVYPETTLSVEFKVPIEAEVYIYYNIAGGFNNDVDADLEDSDHKKITSYGRICGNGARRVHLSAGEYGLNLGNSFAAFSKKKVFLRLHYRELQR